MTQKLPLRNHQTDNIFFSQQSSLAVENKNPSLLSPSLEVIIYAHVRSELFESSFIVLSHNEGGMCSLSFPGKASWQALIISLEQSLNLGSEAISQSAAKS